MLSEADLEEIRHGLREGLRGPILLKWVRELLADRNELSARLRDAQAAERRSAAQKPAQGRRAGR